MESRVEMHEAQITKMQRALEEADQEKARLEEDLEVALAAGAMKSLSIADKEVILLTLPSAPSPTLSQATLPHIQPHTLLAPGNLCPPVLRSNAPGTLGYASRTTSADLNSFKIKFLLVQKIQGIREQLGEEASAQAERGRVNPNL